MKRFSLLIFLMVVFHMNCVNGFNAHHNLHMSGYKVEEISSEGQRCTLGEGPHWDPKSKSLYYVDILAPAIFRYNTKNGEIYKAKIKDNEKPIGFIVPVEGTDDEFVVGAGRDITIIRWDGKSGQATVLRVLGEVDKQKPGNRINDGKCDPRGTLFFGTMGENITDSKSNLTGSFFHFSVGDGAKNLKSSIGISNGLTWNETLRKFYYIDSITQDVKVFDYDASTGALTNEAVLFDFKSIFDEKTFPDGMTIDKNGNLYVATWGGSKIYVINPQRKEILREIAMPVAQVTSVAFGGPNLETLYVTTAAEGGKPKPAGGLFKITGLGVSGLPMSNFKLY